MELFQLPWRRAEACTYNRLSAHGKSVQVSSQNWTPADIDVKIENVRGREQSSEFSLKLTGFEFHKSPSVVKDFGNEALIKSTYYEECIQHLKSITGASRVVIHDHRQWLNAVICSGKEANLHDV